MVFIFVGINHNIVKRATLVYLDIFSKVQPQCVTWLLLNFANFSVALLIKKPFIYFLFTV